jgi:hypothetical protein
MLTHPIGVYINWAAYDELSDNVELTEALALRQLQEVARLRGLGVRLDYYLNDAFWFAPDGGYRTFRTPHWPDGPDRWLDGCAAAGVKPGLWVTANTLCKMTMHPAWADSFDAAQQAMCCFYGGYLPHFLESLHGWYKRGVRMFKFDFANFSAAPAALKAVMLPSEIRTANILAFQGAMKAFRQAHPEVVFIAYNGFEEEGAQGGTGLPLRRTISTSWLDVFDSLYCGDPRPADVPCMQFWRAKDIYSDHMVRHYLANGYPAPRIDNSGFMIGTTGTCYFRGTAAWQGMLLLSLARGGWVNTYYGNLDLLTDDDARWFARAQARYLDLQAAGVFGAFGGVPGEEQPYGFSAMTERGGLLAVVNPTQTVATISLPVGGLQRVLFHDAGFTPVLTDGALTLGPEQMAVVGVNAYADPGYDLGVQADVTIPQAISPIAAPFVPDGPQAITAEVAPVATGRLRVIMRQRKHDVPRRSSGGSPPDGTLLGQIFRIEASQHGAPVPVAINYDKAIWSGLSWAVGEIDAADLTPATPVTLRLSTTADDGVTLTGEVYAVEG